MKKIKHVLNVISDIWKHASEDFQNWTILICISVFWFPFVVYAIGYEDGIILFILGTMFFAIISFCLTLITVVVIGGTAILIEYTLKGLYRLKRMWEISEKRVLKKKNEKKS